MPPRLWATRYVGSAELLTSLKYTKAAEIILDMVDICPLSTGAYWYYSIVPL